MAFEGMTMPMILHEAVAYTRRVLLVAVTGCTAFKSSGSSLSPLQHALWDFRCSW